MQVRSTHMLPAVGFHRQQYSKSHLWGRNPRPLRVRHCWSTVVELRHWWSDHEITPGVAAPVTCSGGQQTYPADNRCCNTQLTQGWLSAGKNNHRQQIIFTQKLTTNVTQDVLYIYLYRRSSSYCSRRPLLCMVMCLWYCLSHSRFNRVFITYLGIKMWEQFSGSGKVREFFRLIFFALRNIGMREWWHILVLLWIDFLTV